MNTAHMSIEELQAYINYLQEQAALIESFSSEGKSKYGERELARKRADLALMRSRYKDIDVANPHALVFLAIQQGAEKTVLMDIGRLVNAVSEKERLDAEILECIDTLNERKKSSTSQRR
jgi:hypothetical protein